MLFFMLALMPLICRFDSFFGSRYIGKLFLFKRGLLQYERRKNVQMSISKKIIKCNGKHKYTASAKL